MHRRSPQSSLCLHGCADSEPRQWPALWRLSTTCIHAWLGSCAQTSHIVARSGLCLRIAPALLLLALGNLPATPASGEWKSCHATLTKMGALGGDRLRRSALIAFLGLISDDDGLLNAIVHDRDAFSGIQGIAGGLADISGPSRRYYVVL